MSSAFPMNWRRWSPWILAFGCLIGFLLARSPFFFNAGELSKDESQMMALAMRMTHDWVPWSSITSETNGPFLPGLLALCRVVGVPVTFGLVHLLAALIQAGCLLLGWRVALRFAGGAAAGAALVAMTLALAFTPTREFSHLSTELLPLLFLGVGLVLLVAEDGGLSRLAWRRLAGMFWLGLVPWAKLQCGPMALFVCLWCAVAIYAEVREGRRRLHDGLLCLAGMAFACLVPTLLMLAVCWFGGSLAMLWNCYFVFNLAYAGSKPMEVLLDHLRMLLLTPWIMLFLVQLVVAFAVCRNRLWRSGRRLPLLLVSGLVAAALYSVLRPKYAFPHYSVLLLVPCELGMAFLLSEVLADLRPRTGGGPWRLPRPVVAALGLLLLAPLPLCLALNWMYVSAALHMPWFYGYSEAELAMKVSKQVPQGEGLLVWGWHPALYVYLDAMPATRFAHHGRLVIESPARDFLRERFMEDLRKSTPGWVVIVDDGFWFPIGYAKPFPQLLNYLNAHYSVVSSEPTLVILKRRD